jgi:hypothetical protein
MKRPIWVALKGRGFSRTAKSPLTNPVIPSRNLVIPRSEATRNLLFARATNTPA